MKKIDKENLKRFLNPTKFKIIIPILLFAVLIVGNLLTASGNSSIGYSIGILSLPVVALADILPIFQDVFFVLFFVTWWYFIVSLITWIHTKNKYIASSFIIIILFLMIYFFGYYEFLNAAYPYGSHGPPISCRSKDECALVESLGCEKFDAINKNFIEEHENRLQKLEFKKKIFCWGKSPDYDINDFSLECSREVCLLYKPGSGT